MSNFVDDLTNLDYPKQANRPTPAGKEDFTCRAVDWNRLCQAVIDLRGALLDLRTSVGGEVLLSQLEQIDSPRVVGRITSGTGEVEQLTGADVTTILSLFTADAKGVVPATGGASGRYLKDDGTWDTVSVSVGDPVFGAGQDGALSFNGGAVAVATGPVGNVYTLTQNVAATDVDIGAAYTVKTNGYAIFVSGTLSGAGKIHNNGSAGTSIVTGSEAGNGGAGAPGATLPGGAVGGGGAINNGSSASDGAGSNLCPTWNPIGAGGAGGTSTGGNGSVGGTCKGGGSGGRKDSYSVGSQPGRVGGSVGSISSDTAYMECLISGRNFAGNTFGGSTGGGGAPSPDSYNDSIWVQGVDGAGGGGGGGWVVVTARNCTFSGTVEAKGGNGGSGWSYNVGGTSGGCGGPGAGGGGGGTIVFVIGGGTLPTLDVSGGAGGIGGTASGGTANNDKGGDGGAGGSGKIITVNLGS